MALSENIKFKRQSLKLSQEYVAEQLGVSRQAVSKWESGQSEPTAKNLAELAALFGIGLSELISPENSGQESFSTENKSKEKKKNHLMLVSRWTGYIFLTTGYSGYSGYYNSGLSGRYWLAILVTGLVLLLITSISYFKKSSVKPVQFFLGTFLIGSIFFLPMMIRFNNGTGILISHIVTFSIIAILNLKFWRYVWKCN